LLDAVVKVPSLQLPVEPDGACALAAPTMKKAATKAVGIERMKAFMAISFQWGRMCWRLPMRSQILLRRCGPLIIWGYR
jgi:hypothetical protein